MKIPTKATSRFLAQEDVAAPFVATMDRVTIDTTLRNPYVLHFTDDQLKPMVLNVTNRRAIVAGYGDDDDNWHGKPIEVYVNPDVTNAQGEVVGGLRARVPKIQSAAAKPSNGTLTTSPTSPTPPVVEAPDIERKHRIVLDGYKTARTEAKVKEFADWADRIDFAPHHLDEQSDAYHDAMDRVSRQPAKRQLGLPSGSSN